MPGPHAATHVNASALTPPSLQVLSLRDGPPKVEGGGSCVVHTPTTSPPRPHPAWGAALLPGQFCPKPQAQGRRDYWPALPARPEVDVQPGSEKEVIPQSRRRLPSTVGGGSIRLPNAESGCRGGANPVTEITGRADSLTRTWKGAPSTQSPRVCIKGKSCHRGSLPGMGSSLAQGSFPLHQVNSHLSDFL